MVFGDPVKALDSNVPFWAQAHKAYSHGSDGDFGAVAGDITDLALNGAAAWADPLNVLIGAGLGFLIDWCTPLKDAISWVTGNANTIEDHRKTWSDIQAKLNDTASNLSNSISSDLAGWEGDASVAAKARLQDFLEGVQLTSDEVGKIMGLLALSGGLMDTALEVIKGILSQFVEWLILTWLAAQAAAVPTLGASEAAAAAATTGEVAVATSRAMTVIQKVTAIFRKIMEIVRKIKASISEIGVKAFKPLAYEARHAAPGPKILGDEYLGGLRNAARNAGGSRIRDFRPGLELDPRESAKALGLDAAKAAAPKAGGGLLQDLQDSKGEPDPIIFDNPSGEEINDLLNSGE